MGEDDKIYVIDTSFVLAFLLPDESTDSVDKLFDKHANLECQLISCPLIIFEVCNSLRSCVLKKRISSREALILEAEFEALEIKLVDPNYSKTLKLAISKKISFYDASYIQLAVEQHATLLTLDKIQNQV